MLCITQDIIRRDNTKHIVCRFISLVIGNSFVINLLSEIISNLDNHIGKSITPDLNLVEYWDC